jgi:hypothetical protein
MRTLLMALAAVLAAAGMAAAQVAAPSLNPTPTLSLMPVVTPNTIFVPGPSNPAVLPWDGPSRIAAAYGTAKLTDIAIAPTINPVAKGTARGVLVEGVGETFAAAAQVNTSRMDIDPVFATGSLETKVQRIGLAAQFGKRFSVGLGSESVENTNTSFTPALDFQQSLVMGGATVRLGEVFYFGAAGGTETIKDKLTQEQVKRNALQYGIAYLWRDKERGAHIEAYHAQRPAKLYPSMAPAAAANDVNGFTVEVMLARVLLGYSTQQDKTKNDVGTPLDKNSVATLTLGYDMAPGLAFVLSKYDGKSENASTGTVNFKTSGMNAGVAYQF